MGSDNQSYVTWAERAAAAAIYTTLCDSLNDDGVPFIKDPGDYSVRIKMQGECLPVGLTITVEPGRYIVSFISGLPFRVAMERRREAAVAISIVNNLLTLGSFDYDFRDGSIIFRMTLNYSDSLINRDALSYTTFLTCKTVDIFNGNLMMYTGGAMSLDDFRAAAERTVGKRK